MSKTSKKFAKIALGLPLRTTFDYGVPAKFRTAIRIGSRVKVPFRSSLAIGYVAGFASKSAFKGKIRPIYSLIDTSPAIPSPLLKLAQKIADYYFCSLGEALETVIPSGVRKGREIYVGNSSPERKLHKEFSLPLEVKNKLLSKTTKPIVMVDNDFEKAQTLYFEMMKSMLNKGKGVILLAPDRFRLRAILENASQQFDEEVSILSTTLKEGQNFENWQKIFDGTSRVVIGTRSAVFAPVANLGLIIVDEVQDDSYFQEEKPYYHTKDIAIIRSQIEKAKLCFGVQELSVELFYKIKQKEFDLIDYSQKSQAQIQAVDLRSSYASKSLFISKPLEISIQGALNNSKKIALFFYRKGAGIASCKKCGYLIKCERCDLPLTYDRKSKLLKCSYCNYKIRSLEFCPNCKKSYIHYQGLGVQKIENRLYNIFPQAKILSAEFQSAYKKDFDFDILVGTQAIFKYLNQKNKVWFSALLLLDPLLSVFNFRSSEKAFNIITRLANLSEHKVIVQTYNPDHYLLKSLVKNDHDLFFKEELRLRKDLRLPPYYHIMEIQLRDSDEKRLQCGIDHFYQQAKNSLPKNLLILEPIFDHPYKLRSNYRQKIIFKSKNRSILLLLLDKIYDNLKKTNITSAIIID